jgi:hypothetical protein
LLYYVLTNNKKEHTLSKNTVNVNIKTDFADWNTLFKDRQWLAEHNTHEAKWLEVLINEMWHNEAVIVWDMICKQKAWLQTFTDDTAQRLEDFIEQLQDSGVDSEDFPIDEIYGRRMGSTSATIASVIKKPNHLKLVVSNYFRPLERIDQPCKPDPVLTLI